MKSDYDAVIVGGGPAGSTAAILLANAGWRVALVEKSVFPRRKVCGECIAAPNLALFDALGIGAQFDALAGPDLREVGLFAGDQQIVAPLPDFADATHRWGRVLSREILDTLLLKRAAASHADVLQPWRVRSVVAAGPGRKICQLVGRNCAATTMALSARVVIAANGSWEADPFSARGKEHPPQASDLFAFKGTYRDASLRPGLLPVLAFDGGYGGMVLGDRDQLTLAFCIRRDTLRRCRRLRPQLPVALAAQAHVASSCASVRDALASAAPLGRWLGVGPIRPGLRAPWRDDEIFAIGNAAGEAHPILGEGISMAVQSAWMLCRLLIEHGGPAAANASELGRRYAACWRRSFLPRMHVAAVLAHAAMRPRLTAAALCGLRRWPQLLTHSARLGAKVRGVV